MALLERRQAVPRSHTRPKAALTIDVPRLHSRFAGGNLSAGKGSALMVSRRLLQVGGGEGIILKFMSDGDLLGSGGGLKGGIGASAVVAAEVVVGVARDSVAEVVVRGVSWCRLRSWSDIFSRT